MSKYAEVEPILQFLAKFLLDSDENNLIYLTFGLHLQTKT